jgi:hypothetical protein
MPEVTEDDATDTEQEFRQLYADAEEQKRRFLKLALAAPDAVTKQLYQELSGTVMSMITDLIASTGGALGDVERRVDAVEDQIEGAESFLTHEDGQHFLLYLEQVSGFLTSILALAEPSADAGTAQEIEKLRALLELTRERIDFVHSITAEEPDPDDDDDDDDNEEEDEDEVPPRQDAE